MPSQIVADLANLSYRELQQKCRDRRLPSGGSSNALCKRLLTQDAPNAAITPPGNKRQKKSPTDDLICPITLELPFNPVMAEDGRVYEKEAIVKHIKSWPPADLRSPLTNNKMGSRLVPALQHKNLIETLVEDGAISEDLASKWIEKSMEKKSMQAILEKATGGDPQAMFLVGAGYFQGARGFKHDFKLAFTWFEKAHTVGQVKATAMLGLLLCRGDGCKASYPMGMMYLGIATGQGSDFGAYVLGEILARGVCGVEKNKLEGINWLRKAVNGSCQCKHMSTNDKVRARKLLLELEGSIVEFHK